MNIKSLFYFSLECYNVGLILKKQIARIRYYKWNKEIYKNKKLKTFKNSDVCYICGNGPSLKKVDLNLLNGDTIVLNDYWRIATKYNIEPTYYIVCDENYCDDEFRDRLEGVLNCSPHTPHLMSIKFGPTLEHLQFNANVFYFNPIGQTYHHKYNIDFTKCTYTIWNVVTAAIQLAIYVGYKKIYLIGCDYSLFASRFLTHVYEKDGEKIPRSSNLRDVLYKYSFTTHIHYEVAKYAKSHGIEIINLTSETLLDAYNIDGNSKY